MKTIMNAVDAQTVYRIEAARISFELLNQAFEELNDTLMAIEQKESLDYEYEYKDALNAIKFGLHFIDCTHRFFSVLSQIRGLKHKDDRFKKAESYANKLVRVRNFAQHLNSEIPKITSETYPILGAISWASEDRGVSRTLSLGALPPGTTLQTLVYDTKEQGYNKSVVFNIGNLEIDLTETWGSMVSAQQYFSEWLTENQLLSNQDLVPNMLVADRLDGIPSDLRYFRAKYLINTHDSVSRNQ